MNRAASAAAPPGGPIATVHHPSEPAAPVAPPAPTGPDRAPDPLAGRLGAALVRMRRGLEQDYRDSIGAHRYRFLGLERYRLTHLLIELGVRGSGLSARGRRNATTLTLVERTVPIAALPGPFDGLRILHLSDLHLDLDASILQAIIDRVRPLDYDLCVLTGDYRAWTIGPFEPALAALARLRPHLHGPVYGTLGNSDSIEMVPPIEALGIRLLMNESLPIERGGERVFLAGIDDPNRYRTHNLEAAAAAIPPDAPAILLAHAPEPFRAAASLGFALMLCGHTHGGQICLPGGFALIGHSRAPHWVRAGAWRWRQMQGYTSRGAGSSIIAARFNCPPEVTIHCLRRAAAADCAGTESAYRSG
ncbi:metallophosphoesterase [uncultured Thiodictyon sp.]|uniref:metallophosphoesterase n=1 Tax=uncultured Thiodictyon sp. TaxID=1846217 RepID=UPI0025F7C877|nr:metallophosphoesterase [uncultured Thiodictyon sp.]